MNNNGKFLKSTGKINRSDSDSGGAAVDPSDQHDDQLELDPNVDLDIIMDIEVLLSNFLLCFMNTKANGKKGMRVVTWMSMNLMILKLLRWNLTHSKWTLMMIAIFSGF